LLKHVPGLEDYGMDLRTVARLFRAPHLGRRAAGQYQNQIDARVYSSLRNDINKENVDAHYSMAQVKLLRELVSDFRDEVGELSADTMNGLKVGVLAVTRYHQLGKLLLKSVRCNDHDFGLPDYSLKVTGFMELTPKEPRLRHSIDVGALQRPQRDRALDDVLANPDRLPDSVDDFSLNPPESGDDIPIDHRYVRDEHGRLHYKLPLTGRLHMGVQAPKFRPLNAQSHANLLAYMVQQRTVVLKPIMLLVTDKGPDFSPKSDRTLMAWGRFFRDQHLSALLIVTNAGMLRG
jgi:hypothetical protein